MKIFVLLNLILVHIVTINCQHEHYFSSLVRLEKLAVMENEFITKLKAIADEISSDDYVKM